MPRSVSQSSDALVSFPWSLRARLPVVREEAADRYRPWLYNECQRQLRVACSSSPQHRPGIDRELNVAEDNESASTLANGPACPLLDLDSRGNVVCFGWVSPIYTFDLDILND